MKTTLVTIIVAGLVAGLVDATPASALNKRRVEKKRDAQKVLRTTQTSTTAAQDNAETKKAAAASLQTPSAPAAKRSPTAQTPAAAVAPAEPAAPSELSRSGKPPSRRFFSRLRSDASRDQTKAMRLAKKPAPPSAQSGPAKALIYRRSWGPRAHRRPR